MRKLEVCCNSTVVLNPEIRGVIGLGITPMWFEERYYFTLLITSEIFRRVIQIDFPSFRWDADAFGPAPLYHKNPEAMAEGLLERFPATTLAITEAEGTYREELVFRLWLGPKEFATRGFNRFQKENVGIFIPRIELSWKPAA